MSMRMTRAVDRYFWVVRLGVVGLVAVLVGWTASSLLGAALVGRGRVMRARGGGTLGAVRPAGLSSSGGAVQRRNLFCSGCGGVVKPAPEPPSLRAVRLDDAVLVATQVVAGDAGWTLAEVRFPGAGQLRVVGQGSRVADARITRVTARQVEFVRAGRTGVLRLVPGQATKAPAPRAAPGPSPRCPTSIRRLGAGRFGIDRTLLGALLRGMGGGSGDVAVAPLQLRGRLAGLRVLRVRRGSVFHCLGLRARDQVTAVNHRQLTSPDVLLTLMAELPGARHVTVSVIRQGRPRTFDYSIE